AFHEPGGRLFHPAIFREAPRELLGCFLGLELTELCRFVREQRARLQLEERRDEHEKLTACLEIELVSRCHVLDESENDRRDVDVARLELLLQEQREKQVERSFERIELEIQLSDGRRKHAREASRAAGRACLSAPSAPPWSRSSAARSRHRASSRAARSRRTRPIAGWPHQPRTRSGARRRSRATGRSGASRSTGDRCCR